MTSYQLIYTDYSESGVVSHVGGDDENEKWDDMIIVSTLFTIDYLCTYIFCIIGMACTFHSYIGVEYKRQDIIQSTLEVICNTR